MKEEQKQLSELQEKISNTWGLLDIDGQIEEMKKLEMQMQAEGFWNDQENATKISKRHEEVRSEIETWQSLKKRTEDLLSLIGETEEDTDEEMEKEIKIEIKNLADSFERLEFFLLFDGKHDQKNAILTVRAGSGGTEAQDWAEMILRMILRFCEKKGWSTLMLDESRGGEAGIKSATVRVEGRYAFGYLQSEHGTHRLVRISPFDAESMRHTSFCGVEVIPEMEDTPDIVIDEKDLRIDTFMSGGKGGQSVNTTYSAVRIVHLPTGITVQCQNERSQQQNRETAMKVLASKLQTLKEEEMEAERLELRGEHKSAEWGNQIRNYVLHPYKMVKDVRTRYETKDPDAVLNGELDAFMEAYLRWKKRTDNGIAR